MTTRRIMTTGLAVGAASLLSSCGTIIYPDRVNQEERGNLDPAIIILDGIGLFFFIIPGVIAFAVDFTTGAIYLPEGKENGDKERTIFDDLSMHTPANGKLQQQEIEDIVSKVSAVKINLSDSNVRAMELKHINQFWMAKSRLSGQRAVAAL
ncbi:MAG: hypothetical protein V3V05_06175 [Pontiella sp.]